MTQKEQESGAVFSGKAIAVLVAEDHKEQIRLFCDLAKSLKGEFSFFLCVFSETPESFIEEWQNRIPKCMTVHLVKLAPRVRLRSLMRLLQTRLLLTTSPGSTGILMATSFGERVEIQKRIIHGTERLKH